MSMFKGQGANQALSDGPTLVQWVRYQHARRRDTHAGKMRGMTRESLVTRIRQYESEMIHRSSHKVFESRQACQFYHSPQACQISTFYGLGMIVGVRPGEVTLVEVLQELKRKGCEAAEYCGVCHSVVR